MELAPPNLEQKYVNKDDGYYRPLSLSTRHCLQMKQRLGFIILACLALTQPACGLSALTGESRRDRAETRARIAARMNLDETITVGELKRTYKVHVPPSSGKDTPLPLVIVLHGGFGNAYAIEMQSEMSLFADKAGFVVAYPEGLGKALMPSVGRSWNGGECCNPAAARKIDDVAFIAAMIDDLAKKVNIDRKRVYATGLSNGAIMSYRLACDLSDRIAAIAPVGGPNTTISCTPAHPVSVIHFHGTADPCSPYTGGPGGGCAAKALGFEPKPIFNTPPIPEIVKNWAGRIHAPLTPRTTLQKGAVTCITYGPGDEGAEAALCTIEGGGHTWPGGVEKLQSSLVGTVNRDISANQVMWEFFQRHAR
jgi:polyhydroxybutyrate depolymerase